MPYGRREAAWPRRPDRLQPDRLVVLARGGKPAVAPQSHSLAGRHLVAGTYMAGELRRYWAFAATLALGTGLGGSHPPVQAIADTLSSRLPCLRVTLGDHPGAPLRELLAITHDGDGHGGIGMTGNAITGSRLRVAQVITRFMAGAGWVALSGALALDPDCFEVVFLAGEAADAWSRRRATPATRWC